MSDFPSPLPEGITDNDLVDGPKVVHLPSGRATFIGGESGAPVQPTTTGPAPATLVQPIPQPAAVVQPINWPPPSVSGATAKKDYPAVIEAALDILSARLLGLIALVTACLIWAGVIFDPEIWRIVAACGFSLSVFLPIMVIYWRAGMTGEGG
jgi:hypothetical protein